MSWQRAPSWLRLALHLQIWFSALVSTHPPPRPAPWVTWLQPTVASKCRTRQPLGVGHPPSFLLLPACSLRHVASHLGLQTRPPAGGTQLTSLPHLSTRRDRGACFPGGAQDLTPRLATGSCPERPECRVPSVPELGALRILTCPTSPAPRPLEAGAVERVPGRGQCAVFQGQERSRTRTHPLPPGTPFYEAADHAGINFNTGLTCEGAGRVPFLFQVAGRRHRDCLMPG